MDKLPHANTAPVIFIGDSCHPMIPFSGIAQLQVQHRERDCACWKPRCQQYLRCNGTAQMSHYKHICDVPQMSQLWPTFASACMLLCTDQEGSCAIMFSGALPREEHVQNGVFRNLAMRGTCPECKPTCAPGSMWPVHCNAPKSACRATCFQRD